MEILLVGFVALVFKVTELICEKKQLSVKQSFTYGFFAVLVAFVLVIGIGVTIRPDGQPVTQTRLFVWMLGAIGLSVAAGFKCSMAASSKNY